MTIWFTSDTHYFHTNILKHANRAYLCVEDMNEDLIKRYNEVVKPKDTVYHLGDFSFGNKKDTASVIRRLNGTIHLILGNHDKVIKGSIKDMFESVSHYKEIKGPDKRKIILCHYAFRVWNGSHRGAWNLHGHSHGTLEDLGIKQIDVGVDVHDMYPISMEEIEVEMSKRGFDAPDHHGQRK